MKIACTIQCTLACLDFLWYPPNSFPPYIMSFSDISNSTQSPVSADHMMWNHLLGNGQPTRSCISKEKSLSFSQQPLTSSVAPLLEGGASEILSHPWYLFWLDQVQTTTAIVCWCVCQKYPVQRTAFYSSPPRHSALRFLCPLLHDIL